MSDPASAIPYVLAFGAVVAAVRIALLARRWTVGAPAETRILAGLAALPARYLRDVHAVVARKPVAARMHAALAGGFLAALALAAALAAVGQSRLLAVLVLLASALGLYGLLLQGRRRLPERPPYLSGGSWRHLTSAFALAFVFFAACATFGFGVSNGPAILAALVCGALGLGWLAWTIADGPMRHAVAGAVHLVVHPRPGRFGSSRPDAALRTIDLGGERLGAGTAADFAWSRLAGFDSCVQCGRCETACPAFAAGLPLNPKRLVQDISAKLAPAGTRLRYAGSPHPHVPLPQMGSGPATPLVVDLAAAVAALPGIRPETLWACTTCRACVQECPMMIEHVDAVIDLRRHQTLEFGAAPGKASEILENLDKTDNAAGRPLAERLDWAADLALPRMSTEAEVDVLLWLGEGAFNRRNQRTLRAFVQLLRRAGVDFAVLGEEPDCGDLARRLGDEAGFRRLAEANVAMLAELRFRRIVTVDPHVLHGLRNEYPAVGGCYVVEHHTEVLAALVASGRLAPARTEERRLTFHDPCYLGRYNGETAAPRTLLTALSGAVVEMDRSGLRSRCCGGGGGAPVTDIAGDRRIPDIRMEDAKATLADVVVTACPYCTQMLEGVSEPRPAVVDVAELLLSSLGEEA